MTQENFLGEFKLKMHVQKEQYESPYGDRTVQYFGWNGEYKNLPI